MIKLSVTIITLNEEENLANALQSVKDLADEVILVDSGSTDKTLEIAKGFGAKIFYRKFDNFANQKNYALEKVAGEWVLSLDADEVITPELAEEIKHVMQKEEYDGFSIPRRNFILGAEIKHSRWAPDKHIWLFKKDLGKWEGDVHEEIVVEGKVGELEEGKVHYQDKTISEFVSSNKKYAKIYAQKLVSEGKDFSPIRFIWDPLLEFGIRYIYKKGFLDGWRGLVLAILMAFYKIDIWRNVFILNRK